MGDTPSLLGNVIPAPAPTQTEKIARTYQQRRPAAPSTTYVPARPRPPMPPPTPGAVRQAAERDKVAPFLTQTQKVAGALYGHSSRTIPQANPAIAAYRQRAQEIGVTDSAARALLDEFLKIGDEPPR